MNNETRILTEAYDAGAEDEFLRLASPLRKKLEFETICRAVESRINSQSVIIDIGCGPGRYAEYFLNQEHFVGCVDLSAKSLKMFSDRIQSVHTENLLFNTVSCATSLEWITDHSADIILLMGPMYHLTGNHARMKVLQHCHRILKPNGFLVVMYMSPRPVFDESGNQIISFELRNHGIKTYASFQEKEVPQFRSRPSQAIKEASSFFSPKVIIPVEDEENKTPDSTVKSFESELTTSQFVIMFQPH